MTGLVVLVAAVVVALLVALVRRRVDGRFRDVGAASAPPAPTDGPVDGSTDGPADEVAASDDVDAGGTDQVSAREIGADLGEHRTLVQFSSAFCTPCRATRALLADVVADRPDVAHVEVDAESHLDLVRRLGILRTPTVLVVDGRGRVLARASGVPRRDQVVAALEA